MRFHPLPPALETPALGWFSLFLDTTGAFNTGVGGGTLALNNGDVKYGHWRRGNVAQHRWHREHGQWSRRDAV